jgi:hypothetical protein
VNGTHGSTIRTGGHTETAKTQRTPRCRKASHLKVGAACVDALGLACQWCWLVEERVFNTGNAEGIQRREHNASQWRVGSRDVDAFPVAGARIELERRLRVTLSSATPLRGATSRNDTAVVALRVRHARETRAPHFAREPSSVCPCPVWCGRPARRDFSGADSDADSDAE